MAEPDSSTTQDIKLKDPLESSPFYRLRRDTMMIVASLNSSAPVRPTSEELKRQIALVQSQLFLAAIADPRFPQKVKNDLIQFHNDTIKDLLNDKRGSKQRKKAALQRHENGDQSHSPLHAQAQ